MKRKSFQYRLEEVEHRELKIFCAQHGFTMQDFVDKAIAEYMKKWAV